MGVSFLVRIFCQVSITVVLAFWEPLLHDWLVSCDRTLSTPSYISSIKNIPIWDPSFNKNNLKTTERVVWQSRDIENSKCKKNHKRMQYNESLLTSNKKQLSSVSLFFSSVEDRNNHNWYWKMPTKKISMPGILMRSVAF